MALLMTGISDPELYSPDGVVDDWDKMPVPDDTVLPRHERRVGNHEAHPRPGVERVLADSVYPQPRVAE